MGNKLESGGSNGMGTDDYVRGAMIAAAVLALTLSPFQLIADAACRPATEADITRLGWNPVVITHPAVTAVRGVVISPDNTPMDDALVEVYDHPEVVINAGHATAVQRRIAACITNSSGRFFLNVPQGYYEVRFTKSDSIGWERTSVLVKVRSLALRRRFRARMEVAH